MKNKSRLLCGVALILFILNSMITATTIPICIIYWLDTCKTVRLHVPAFSFSFFCVLLCTVFIGQPFALHWQKDVKKFIQNERITKKLRLPAEGIVLVLLCLAGICVYQLHEALSIALFVFLVCGYLVSVLHIFCILLWNHQRP